MGMNARLLLFAMLLAVAFLVGHLAGDGGGPPPARESPDARRVQQLEIRIAELERRMEWEARPAAGPRPSDAGPPPAEAAVQASESRDVPAPRPSFFPARALQLETRSVEQLKQAWLQHLGDGATPEARVAVVRDGSAKLKKLPAPAAVREFLEEVVRSAGPASEEGIEATFLLSYEARTDHDYARSDDLIRGIERLARPESPQWAMAQFQLAWNRKFTGDAAAAEELFHRAADAPGVERTTKAAAWYALAGIRGDAGDAAGSRALLERILEEARRHPADQGLAYYAGLARALLEA